MLLAVGLAGTKATGQANGRPLPLAAAFLDRGSPLRHLSARGACFQLARKQASRAGIQGGRRTQRSETLGLYDVRRTAQPPVTQHRWGGGCSAVGHACTVGDAAISMMQPSSRASDRAADVLAQRAARRCTPSTRQISVRPRPPALPRLLLFVTLSLTCSFAVAETAAPAEQQSSRLAPLRRTGRAFSLSRSHHNHAKAPQISHSQYERRPLSTSTKRAWACIHEKPMGNRTNREPGKRRQGAGQARSRSRQSPTIFPPSFARSDAREHTIRRNTVTHSPLPCRLSPLRFPSILSFLSFPSSSSSSTIRPSPPLRPCNCSARWLVRSTGARLVDRWVRLPCSLCFSRLRPSRPNPER